MFADFDGFDFELRSRGLEDGEGGLHDFGADAIAESDCDGSFTVRAHNEWILFKWRRGVKGIRRAVLKGSVIFVLVLGII